jgi:transposase
MTMLADEVDVVIGVDAHKHTHTAVAASSTGGSLGEITVSTDVRGYRRLLAFAMRWPGPRAWAIEGAGGYGVGLYRFLADRGERVVELDRPGRPPRRGGAKSDPIDALRAAREALSRDHRRSLARAVVATR